MMSFEKSSPHSVMAVLAQHNVKQWSEFVESSLGPWICTRKASDSSLLVIDTTTSLLVMNSENHGPETFLFNFLLSRLDPLDRMIFLTKRSQAQIG